jgi:hypothetical protein
VAIVLYVQLERTAYYLKGDRGTQLIVFVKQSAVSPYHLILSSGFRICVNDRQLRRRCAFSLWDCLTSD